MPDTIDSNATGLRIVEEASFKTLPGSPVWEPLEPNDYGDFGATVVTTPRNPINPSGQRRKGPVTDLDVVANFSTDVTQASMRFLLPGILWSTWDEATSFGGGGEITAVDGVADEYEGTNIQNSFQVGNLIFGSGFTNAGNNGLKRVISVAGPNAVGVAESLTAEASPPNAAKVKIVGFQGTAGDIDVDAAGANPALTSTSLDFTTLGLNIGEWIHIGGDGAAFQFSNAVNNGFARVSSIATNRLEFDKTQNVMVTEPSTTETIQIFIGDSIHNEDDSANIIRRSFQLERDLSEAGFEYVVGGYLASAQVNIGQASKVTMDVSVLAAEHESVVNGSRKSGTFPAIPEANAYNTTSDFPRLRIATSDDQSTTPLVTFVTETQLNMGFGLTANKAVANLGAISVSRGELDIGGSLTGYFNDINILSAIRNNNDVTYDFAMVLDNAGLYFDIPLMSLSGGNLQVSPNEPVRVPVDQSAARHGTLTYTALVMSFDYLPLLAG
jgi:hypothetical protein